MVCVLGLSEEWLCQFQEVLLLGKARGVGLPGIQKLSWAQKAGIRLDGCGGGIRARFHTRIIMSLSVYCFCCHENCGLQLLPVLMQGVQMRIVVLNCRSAF